MSSLTFEVVDRAGERRIKLRGAIDEGANFSRVEGATVGRVVLDFEKVAAINSTGIKLWIQFLDRVAGKCEIRYDNCPIVVIQQVNCVPRLRQGIAIGSFYLPFSCDSCDLEVSQLVTWQEATAPAFLPSLSQRYSCSKCCRSLSFFEDEAVFFEFLRNDR